MYPQTSAPKYPLQTVTACAGAAIQRIRISAHPSGDVAIYIFLKARDYYDQIHLPTHPDGKYKYAASMQIGARRIYVVIYPPAPEATTK